MPDTVPAAGASEAGEAARDHAAFLRSVLERVADGILVVGADGRVVSWTAGFARLWDLDPASIASARETDLCAAVSPRLKDPVGVAARLRELAGTPGRPAVDLIETRDGRVIERRSQPLELGEGQPGRVMTFREVGGRFEAGASRDRVLDARRAERARRQAEERHRLLVQLSPDGIVIESGERIVFANPAAARLLGYEDPAELAGRPLAEFVPPEYRRLIGERLREIAGRAWVQPLAETRLVHRDGSLVEVEAAGAPFRSEDCDGTQIVLRDLRPRREAERDKRESEARFRKLAETAPCGILIYQLEGITYANPALRELLGYSAEELQGMSIWDLVHPEARQQVRREGLFRPRRGGQGTASEVRIRRRDGSERWVQFSVCFIESGGQAGALATCFDVTERRLAEERIRSLAYHDPLTGLPNRVLLRDRLEMAVAQAHRYRHRLAVLFLDLDHFKVLIESLGHGFGDRLLRAVAERLQAGRREGDTVARIGGDEFVLLLPELGRTQDVARVARKVVESVREPFRIDEREIYVTASLGVSLYPDDGDTAEALLKNADTAMYRAKDEGRDGCQLFTPAMNAAAVQRLALETDLRRAVLEKDHQLLFQPLVEAGSGRVFGLEALLRWRHPRRGQVPPAEFIPLAEATGLILPLGAWVLRTACAEAQRWRGLGFGDLRVAINASVRQLQQADFPEQVRRTLRETGLPGRLLDVEITETHAMQNPEAVTAVLRELKALGLSISIDDFGIGYSSLNYLKRLPIDCLKIDQSFVRDVTADPDDAAIAAAIVALGHGLKLPVLAEGVETEEQRRFLTALGCDRMQGFLFSPPLSAAECEAYLARALVGTP
jgi:diguanylate cyclase (GGDEF)-like protein/PAS domain S-box-containing protein